MDVFPRVQDIRVLPRHEKDPWRSKSGGVLKRPLAIPIFDLNVFFLYDEDELGHMPPEFNIKGMRMYEVDNMNPDPVKLGGTEYHKIRQEIIFCQAGSVRWECEDLYGGKRVYVLDGVFGVWMPPYILHTYKVLQENSRLLIVANTLFDPDDSRTHDTYSLADFKGKQLERIVYTKGWE